jgi:hypothetical protein
MAKVKISTKLEHEYITNYKALQEAFKKVNVEKVCIVFSVFFFCYFFLFALDYLSALRFESKFIIVIIVLASSSFLF